MKELTEALGVTPKFIMVSAITLYVGKVLVSLGKILGVDVVLGKVKQEEISVKDIIEWDDKEGDI